MTLKNKIFKNKLTGDTFTIVDQYQNVAITSNKEKVNTSLLQNNNIFEEVSSLSSVNESFSRKVEDVIDPNNFFDNQRTYDVFAEKIKNVDMSKIKDESYGGDNNVNINLPNDFRPSSNDSAVIMSDPEDEIEELKRKYGATSVDDSLRKQNEVFAKILEEPSENQSEEQPYVPVQLPEQQNNRQNLMNIQNEPPIQRIEVQDPVIGMFKNVKRNTEFKINLKVDGKIPRLDFIEMMEDSYEVSIIEYLADEFTNNLLRDPSIIRNKIISEIKSLIDKKNSSSDKKEIVKSKPDVVNPQITDSVTSEKPKTVRKPRKMTAKKESTE
jgi:hypothetical protein